MNYSSIKVVTAIQARMSSTRLPGKIMLPLAGKPLLMRLVERVKRASLAGRIVVITTESPLDDPIVDLCRNERVLCFRGHPTDLLDRHFRVGRNYNADAVVKIPSDVPLIDPDIIDLVLKKYLSNPSSYDYVSNLHPATYPDGNDVEVVSMKALQKAWHRALKPFEREHTTPYIWDRPEDFKLGNIEWEKGLDYSMSHRWTIDYPEDYDFIKTVYNELYPCNNYFKLEDILDLLSRRPDIEKINAAYLGVNWYHNHLEELETINSEKTRRQPAPF